LAPFQDVDAGVVGGSVDGDRVGGEFGFVPEAEVFFVGVAIGVLLDEPFGGGYQYGRSGPLDTRKELVAVVQGQVFDDVYEEGEVIGPVELLGGVTGVADKHVVVDDRLRA
jgi:hypothetical protein